MSNFKEIVTKAIIGKCKKKVISSYDIECDEKPNTILGCWVINHSFRGVNNLGKVNVSGSFDVNVWYSYDNDTKTTVTTRKFSYTDAINVPIKDNSKIESNSEIIVNALKQPTVTDVKIIGELVNLKIEKELGIEVLGNATVKIQVEDDYDDYEEVYDEENNDELNINVDDLNDDYLESHNMSATFFMVGNKMSSQKDLVKKVYNSNSEIGYHSYDHTLFTKNKIKNIINDFDKTNKIYYEITKDYLSLTRPPYGEYNNKILKALNTSFILWDKDTHDWKYKDTDFIVKYVLENANDKDIILFHDSYKTTVKAVKKLIDILYENNIKVLSVTNYAKENNIKLENKVYYSFK